MVNNGYIRVNNWICPVQILPSGTMQKYNAIDGEGYLEFQLENMEHPLRSSAILEIHSLSISDQALFDTIGKSAWPPWRLGIT